MNAASYPGEGELAYALAPEILRCVAVQLFCWGLVGEIILEGYWRAFIAVCR